MNVTNRIEQNIMKMSRRIRCLSEGRLSMVVLAGLLCGCGEEMKFDASGIFEATTVTVSAETAGKIIEIPAEEGDSVTAGETIARIDTVMLSLQRDQILAQHKAIQSSLPDITARAAALRAQIAHARTEADRQSRLLADGATTARNLDDANSRVKTLKAELEGLMSQLRTSTASLGDNAAAAAYQARQIEEQIAKSTLTSPLTGTVLVKYAQSGEYASPGKPLYKLANLDGIYLRAYFTANQLADLKLGQKVTVTADFGGDEQYEYPGTVAWIAEESEFTPKSIQTKDSRANLVYAVKIRVKNDGRLKLGQYGEVRL